MRENDLSDKEEPKCAKSKTETVEPKRATDLRDKEAPK
jgi:hypothetical protein